MKNTTKIESSIRPNQIKYIYSIRPERLKKYEDEWRSLIADFTGSTKKTSVKDLTFEQANELIHRLGGRTFTDLNWAIFEKTNRQHLQVLSLAHQLGWVRHHYLHGQVVDLHHLSNWLKSKRCPVSKPLKQMNKAELSRIINAMEFMISKRK